MHALKLEGRRVSGPLVATILALALVAPVAAGAASPTQLAPKRRAVLTAGSQPVFKVRDASSAARRYGVFIAISRSSKRNRAGDLKRTSVGTFAQMKRSRSTFSYKAPAYSFPTWFMVRPGTYYWQAYRIDCAAAPNGCHVHTAIRSFKVR